MTVAWETLQRYGIPVARFARPAELADAEAFVATLDGAPACLKADTNEHKAALGLVELGVTAGASVREAWARLEANGARAGIAPPFLIQEQVAPGLEVFAGVTRDPAFGHLLVAGLGGRLIEAIRRSVLRLLPISEAEARAMVAELGLDAIGRPRTLAAFAAVLAGVSRVVEAHPELDELDLNPVILGDERATVVDLRAIAGEPRSAPAAQAHAPEGDLADAHAAIARLLAPRAVAVVGASADPAKPGGRAYRYLAEHAPGVVRHPVNPRGGEIDGTPVLRSVAELPDGVDAAVVATPAASVAPVARELGRRGVPAAVVFASGFKEAGEHAREREVAAAAQAAGVRIAGVNCMGLIGDAPLTFTQALTARPVQGGVSFVTQSGAIGGSLLLGAWGSGLGTARFVSVGNETDLTLVDYLEFLAGDDATRTVGLFVEGVADARRLRAALHALRAAGKGVAVLRTGASDVAAAAVKTHTGALAGSDAAYRQVLRESGAFSAADLPELLGACQALEWQPRARSRGVGVLSTSGGGCSLVADQLAARGLDVPELEPAVRARLAAVLPSFAPTRNPIDTTGDIGSDPGLLGRIVEPVLDSERIGTAVIAISTLVGAAAQQVAESIVGVARTADKPIVVGWMLPTAAVAEQVALLRANRIPVFDSIGLACAAAAALAPSEPEAEGDRRG